MFHKHCIHKLKIFEKMFKIIGFMKQNFIVGNSAFWDHVETYKLLHLGLGMLNPCLHGHLRTQPVAHTPVLEEVETGRYHFGTMCAANFDTHFDFCYSS